MPISLGIGTAVTRGGGLSWSPLSISGLQFWVDADDSATLYTDSGLTTLAVSDGDVIGGWKDKSGNARNALQTDGTKKPLLKTAFLYGRNVVSFAATRQELSAAAGWTIGIYTAFVVRKYNTLSSERFLYYTQNAAGSAGSVGQGYATTSEVVQVSNTTLFRHTTGVSSSAWGQVTNQQASLAGATRLGFRLDGVAYTGTFINNYDPTVALSLPLTLGGLGHSFNYPLDGYISELLIYDSGLSGSDILLVESYLKTKWGTP